MFMKIKRLMLNGAMISLVITYILKIWPMESLSVDHLLGIKFLNQNDLELIFETADNF